MEQDTKETSYVLDRQCAEMEWQDLWGIKSAGTRKGWTIGVTMWTFKASASRPLHLPVTSYKLSCGGGCRGSSHQPPNFYNEEGTQRRSSQPDPWLSHHGKNTTTVVTGIIAKWNIDGKVDAFMRVKMRKV